jgi:hypothetical protein
MNAISRQALAIIVRRSEFGVRFLPDHQPLTLSTLSPLLSGNGRVLTILIK